MPKSFLNFKKNTIYSKFLGFLIKKGNKIGAKRILDLAFFNVSKKTGFSLNSLILKVFLKLNTFVEIRKIRVKRSSHMVPFSITLNRRSYLIIKWLTQAAIQDSRKVSMSEKLTAEILNLIKGMPCKSLKFKELNNSQALSNRSNIHFRW